MRLTPKQGHRLAAVVVVVGLATLGTVHLVRVATIDSATPDSNLTTTDSATASGTARWAVPTHSPGDPSLPSAGKPTAGDSGSPTATIGTPTSAPMGLPTAPQGTAGTASTSGPPRQTSSSPATANRSSTPSRPPTPTHRVIGGPTLNNLWPTKCLIMYLAAPGATATVVNFRLFDTSGPSPSPSPSTPPSPVHQVTVEAGPCGGNQHRVPNASEGCHPGFVLTNTQTCGMRPRIQLPTAHGNYAATLAFALSTLCNSSSVPPCSEVPDRLFDLDRARHAVSACGVGARGL